MMKTMSPYQFKIFLQSTAWPSLLFILVEFLMVKPLNAQINASKGIPSYNNYVVGDLGIAGQQIWNVNQDKDGFIFVGSSSGLQRFDGQNWEMLTSPIADFNTNVRATLLSSQGIFYYGATEDFGFVINDSKGKPLENSLKHLLPEDLQFNDIWSILEVNGKIYFQAREAIFILEPEKEGKKASIEIWKPDTQFMFGFSLDGIYYAHQMNLGLFREKGGVLELISRSEFLGEERVQVLLPYQKPGEFLVGGFSGGLFHFDGQEFIPFKTEIDSLLQSRSLYKALRLPNQTYALSVLGHGFFIIDQNGKIKSHFTIKNSIPDQSVYAFHLDNTDNLWVGTNSGLSKIEIFSPLTRFASENFEVGNALSLNGNGKNLYIGTSTNVLYIDQKDGEIKQVKGVPNDQVFSLVADEDYMISTGDGLFAIQEGKATLIEGTQSFQIINLLISKIHPGYVFISGSFGIHVLKRSQDAKGKFQYEAIGPIAGSNRYVYTLVENEDGELWGGTQSGILFRVIFPKTASGNLDVANAKVEEFSEKDGIRGMSGAVVGPIKGKVYTSGIEGFFYFNQASEKFERDTVFSFSDEIASINLDTYGLAVDQNENVFLDFKGEKRLAVPQSDGSYILKSYPVNLITASFVGSQYSEPNGIFWFGTNEGMIRLDPNSEYKIDHPVPLYFTAVSSGENALDLPKQLSESIPEFPFKGNAIRFQYVAPFFVKENKISYQTFLEGFDEDWGKWENKLYREFSNLPYGTYTFRVRAKNTFNVLSDEISYSFVILPPWYATWWAFIMYFLALGLIVLGLVKIQTNRILVREKNKNREKELAHAREIQKAYEDLKATQAQLVHSEKMASLGELTAGIAHEIQNPLNFVNNFSELNTELIEEMEDEVGRGNLDEVKELLADLKSNEQKIVQHGKRASSIVRGMLAHSRNGSGEKQSVDINVLAEEYLKLAYHGLRAKDKNFYAEFKMDFDSDLPKINVVPQDIGRVLLNLINNAFQACSQKDLPSPASYRGVSDDKRNLEGLHPLVIVSTKNLGDKIEISVKDNGPGIPDSIKDKIFQPFFTTKPTGQGTGLGLSLSYDIVKAHGGELKVESREGEGSEFIIKLPI
ncbi:ATP-binding protein [Shivajiella indica]|uniref:histidine kinase n=1 Tax=Shivajiella indica TaxID=872115 RepID=A0ABW5B385_9BACT